MLILVYLLLLMWQKGDLGGESPLLLDLCLLPDSIHWDVWHWPADGLQLIFLWLVLDLWWLITKFFVSLRNPACLKKITGRPHAAGGLLVAHPCLRAFPRKANNQTWCLYISLGWGCRICPWYFPPVVKGDWRKGLELEPYLKLYVNFEDFI